VPAAAQGALVRSRWLTKGALVRSRWLPRAVTASCRHTLASSFHSYHTPFHVVTGECCDMICACPSLGVLSAQPLLVSHTARLKLAPSFARNARILSTTLRVRLQRSVRGPQGCSAGPAKSKKTGENITERDLKFIFVRSGSLSHAGTGLGRRAWADVAQRTESADGRALLPQSGGGAKTEFDARNRVDSEDLTAKQSGSAPPLCARWRPAFMARVCDARRCCRR
jgi:hypothetical protein